MAGDATEALKDAQFQLEAFRVIRDAKIAEAFTMARNAGNRPIDVVRAISRTMGCAEAEICDTLRREGIEPFRPKESG